LRIIGRRQEAYDWWKRLGSPTKDVLIRKCGLDDVYLDAEDVELLPWLPGGLSVDVRKTMNWIDDIETLEPPVKKQEKGKYNDKDTKKENESKIVSESESENETGSESESESERDVR